MDNFYFLDNLLNESLLNMETELIIMLLKGELRGGD